MDNSAPFNPDISVIPDDSLVKVGTIMKNTDSRGNRGATPDDPNGGSPKGTGSGFTPITVDPSGLGDSPNDGNDPTRGLNQGSSASDFIAAWLDSGLWNPFSPYWAPSSGSSPEENLDSIVGWISGILNYYDFSKWNLESVGKPASNSFNYANLLSTIYRELSKDGHPLGDLSDSATIELSEKISDVTFGFINSQFQQALSYQSWYLQQEYNSPANQVKRLAAAGLSSAFAIGNLNSGNAQSPASPASVQMPSASNAGAIEEQSSTSALGFLGGLAADVVGLIPGVGSFISGICNSKLSLKQIQKSEADIINSAVTEQKLRTEIAALVDNEAYRLFDSQINFSEKLQASSRERVESSRLAYESSLVLGTHDVDVQGFRCYVVDKSGHKVAHDMTVDETREFIKNGGVTSEGYKAVGVSSWENLTEDDINFSGGLSTPFGNVGASGGLKRSEKKSGSNSKENDFSLQHSNEKGSDISSQKYGYNEHGTEFKVGDTTFTSVTLRRKMTNPEHKKYIDSCLKRYNDALNEYDTLVTGEKARLCDLANHLTESMSDFSARVVHGMMMDKLKASMSNKLSRPLTEF